MNPENRGKLDARAVRAAEAALATQGYVSAIDVLEGIGWLAPAHVKGWRTGQLAYLERALQTSAHIALTGYRRSSNKKRRHLEQKVNRPPELVLIQPLTTTGNATGAEDRVAS